MQDLGWRRRWGSCPAARRGARLRAGLTPASASNKLSCLLEMLHSKQLRSIKMLIDSNHGIYRDPTHKTDVPLALTNDCFWERNDSKIELTAKLRAPPVEGRIWYPMSWEEPTKAAGLKNGFIMSHDLILR